MSTSAIERLRSSASREENRERLSKLSPEEIEAILYDWPQWARPNQLTPPGSWSTWLILAGRGFGKTRLAAEQARAWKKQGFKRVNLIGPTAADVRDAIVEGESGVLAVCPKSERPHYYPSRSCLEWPDGSISLLFSAEEPDRLRNKQHDKLICDEIAAWKYAEDSWNQAMFGLRLGTDPQVVATTTPRPTAFIRMLMAQPDTFITRATTYDNKENLAEKFFTQITRKYEGTRLGRQELNAEVLEDNPGALWKLADIEAARLPHRREYRRIVVALDPAVTSDPDSDEWGIVVAGDVDGEHFDVLEDASEVLTPDAAAKRAVQLYWQWEADRVIGEANNGGDMIEALLRHQDANVSYRKVTASRGKQIRAEPIAALYEQRRIHHVGTFAKLEDQMCQWSPSSGGKSPDRVDACLVAGTLVETSRGSIPIESIRVGDLVATRDGFHRVTAAGQTSADAPVFDVFASTGKSIRATGNHPVWTDGGFIRVADLKFGDRLRVWSNIKSYVERVSESGSAPVYNLEVEYAEEYFANGILVHNCVWALTELSSQRGTGFEAYYANIGTNGVKSKNGKGESKLILPKRAREWSDPIRQMAIETAPVVTAEQWRGGLAEELADWILFCKVNGAGARLKFAEKVHAKLESKFAKVVA